MRNAKSNKVSKNYWEVETPIVTEVESAEIRYYKEAGKIQIYPTYYKDDERKLGRACTWDVETFSAEEALKVIFAIMQGLLDAGVENSAFADAYNLLEDEISEFSDEDDADDDVDDEDALDEDFEDEEDDDEEASDEDFEDEEDDESDTEQDAETLLLSLDKVTLLSVYEEIVGKKHKGRFNKNKVIADITNTNVDTDEILALLNNEDTDKTDEVEENDEVTEFVGKKLTYKDGKYKKSNSKVKKVYLEWADDAQEWVTYIAEQAEELNAMPTKTAKQKKAQDSAYAELNADIEEWVSAWEDAKVIKKVSKITDALKFSKITEQEAMCQLIELIDSLSL